MANNRLWAVCRDDNECDCLGKSYGDWSGLRSPDEFFAKHANCPSNHGSGENILFVTEVDDDRVILFDFTQTEEIEYEGEKYDRRKVKIYLKGDEEKPRVKEHYES